MDAKVESMTLEEILRTLENVEAILLLSNQDRLQGAKKSLLPVNSLKTKISMRFAMERTLRNRSREHLGGMRLTYEGV